MTGHAIEHTKSRRIGLMACLTLVGILAGNLPAWAVSGTLWTTLPSLPTDRSSLAAAAAPCPPGQAGTCVYAVGGFTGAAVLGTVESYNPKTNSWSTLPSLPTPRFLLAATAAPCPPGQAGNCVYAVGGSPDNVITVGTIESYNPKTNTWSTLPALPTARAWLGAAAAPCPPGQAGNCVYAVGGTPDGVTPLDTLEAYNPKTNASSTLPALPTARFKLAAAAASCPTGQAGACVYAVGGTADGATPLGTLEGYSPKTNASSTLPSLPTPRFDLAAAAAPCPPGQPGTCVYAVGGNDGATVLGKVEAFDPPA